MRTELMPLGDKGVIAVNRILAIASPDSAPIKRVVSRAEGEGLVINMTYGLKTEAVIFLDSGHIVLAPFSPGEIIERLRAWREADST
ncbi:MAG: DUF370 domain-containing protein [Anaerolineales bacterium]|nr:DUF370 domain-containing protein [Anaerolineales bacterium]